MVADLRAILKHLPGSCWDRRPRGPTGSSTPQPRFVSLRVVTYPEPEALAAVMKRVESDENCTVKRNVTAVLGGLADRGTVWTHFHQHLFTGTPCERLAAMSALAHCPECDEQVASSLVQILTDPSSSLELKEGAAGALVHTWWPDAREPLLAAIANEPDGNVRANALKALVHIGLPEDIPTLKQLIADDPHNGKGVWAVNSREAIKAIEARSSKR